MLLCSLKCLLHYRLSDECLPLTFVEDAWNLPASWDDCQNCLWQQVPSNSQQPRSHSLLQIRGVVLKGRFFQMMEELHLWRNLYCKINKHLKIYTKIWRSLQLFAASFKHSLISQFIFTSAIYNLPNPFARWGTRSSDVSISACISVSTAKYTICSEGFSTKWSDKNCVYGYF